MIRAGWRAGVLGLGLVLMAGCHVVPKRVADAETGKRRHAREARRESADKRSKFDSGLVRTQFEREETRSRTPLPPPATDVNIPAEQRIGVHLDLGRVLESQDQADEALGEYRKAVDAYRQAGNRVRGDSETKAELYRKLARAFDHLGQPEEAKAHYQKAQKHAPRDPKVWNDAGYSAFFQGRFDEAEHLLRKAAKLDPANPRILTNLGMALAAKGKIDPALEVLTKASGPASARINLGYVLASTGQRDEARKQYQAALAIDPKLDLARTALAKLGPETPERTARGRTRPKGDPHRRRSGR